MDPDNTGHGKNLPVPSRNLRITVRGNLDALFRKCFAQPWSAFR